MKNHRYYYKHIGNLRERLNTYVPRDELRELHKIRPARHFFVLARLFLWVGLCGWALWQDAYPWLWIPAAAIQGFNILGFIILLHDQVHEVIFQKPRPRLMRFLGLLYALPSAISATQFRIWHLDHHNELGSEEDDPKRAYLSPKRNARWYKMLYFTPYLFWLYARAAAVEAKTYSAEEQSTIRRERYANIAIHGLIVAALLYFGGPWILLRVYVVPVFFVFPIAFVLNRLGQHYDIDPKDPAKWSTLVNGNPAWRWLMVSSNFHIEHHYYQRVPFYNLKRLNGLLQPFFSEIGHRNRTYRELLWGWLVKNRQPHTNWDLLGE